ncbi:hypothetical protein SAMN00120144_4139 [Hymenobacter roseosalivarius DSM 11622]|uniref:Uncharacterized protein n=1 Tax=Hymenobacter roseosalivarius DSM 11622 TaxID=645990 RepID=A0A1W1VZW1_9BACT|nr:hypothetical protein [Hymenobacter roseosalivarius]SMB98912.1 hypothetical protein SAMN00120144_4139 [Hymenobacter roseosalivarius DSM 11622]
MSERVPYGFSFLLCLVLTVMFSLVLPNKLEEAAVAESGHLVTVDLLRGAKTRFSKQTSYELHFLYNGSEHSTRVSVDYFQQVKDQPTAQLLHLAVYPRLFFAPGHSEQGQVLSGVLLVALSAGGTLWSLFKLVKGA